jgi:hypothetical protein
MRLIDSNIRPMPFNSHMLHIATLTENLHLYSAMLCIKGVNQNQMYIEEIGPGGHYLFIKDENLAAELEKFCNDLHLLDMRRIYDISISSGLAQITKGGTIEWMNTNRNGLTK